MIEKLQSYNAKYKVVKNTEITAFLLFSFLFFYFGNGNKGRVQDGNKAHAFSTMNFDIFAFNKMVVNWPSILRFICPNDATHEPFLFTFMGLYKSISKRTKKPL